MRRMMTALLPVSALAIIACSPAQDATVAPAPAEAASADLAPSEVTPPADAAYSAPTIERLEPEFRRSEPSNGLIAYDRKGEAVTLTFLVGGNPNGAATAADCMIQVRGPQGADDVVRAVVVPSVTSFAEVTEDDIGPVPLKVDVMIGPEGAQVTDHGAALKLCASGVQLDGFYKRIFTPE